MDEMDKLKTSNLTDPHITNIEQNNKKLKCFRQSHTYHYLAINL